MNEVKVWRLLSGEEVVGIEESSNEKQVVIKKPYVIQLMQGPDGAPQMGMAPLLPIAKKNEIVISHDKIMFSYVPVIGLTNQYNKAFGTGIIQPDSQIIT
tara:strand:- start:113 stop:412 length:300 start_codon:yes stop_codon:yes gene_type:complete